MRIVGSGNPYTNADEELDRSDWRRIERQQFQRTLNQFMTRDPRDWLDVPTLATATGIDEKFLGVWVREGLVDSTRQGRRKTTFVNVGSVQRLYRERRWAQ